MVIKYGAAPKRFQSKWDTTQAGSANDTVVLPLMSNPSFGFYNFRIDWGDGKENRDNITVYNQAEVTHQYDDTGIYTIKIVGDITGWHFNAGGDDDKITEINSWGPLVINYHSSFEGCSNLVVTADQGPTMIGDMEQSFKDCPHVTNIGELDLSQVTDMNNMFNGCTGFNQDVSNWNMSNVTNINSIFRFNTVFDQDVGNWDMSNITDIYTWLYPGPLPFNNGGSPSISGWDTSSLTNVGYAFHRCTGFNQPLDGWNMASVTSMLRMFYEASNFNNGGSTGINNWNTASCTSMNSVFYKASSFNQP